MSRPYGQMQVRATTQPWMRHVEIRMGISREDSDKIAFVQPVTFVERADHEVVEPCITLTQHEAQQLMDELWQCGLRPSEGSGSAGSLAATERHLADMKKIAFHALKVTP